MRIRLPEGPSRTPVLGVGEPAPRSVCTISWSAGHHECPPNGPFRRSARSGRPSSLAAASSSALGASSAYGEVRWRDARAHPRKARAGARPLGRPCTRGQPQSSRGRYAAPWPSVRVGHSARGTHTRQSAIGATVVPASSMHRTTARSGSEKGDPFYLEDSAFLGLPNDRSLSASR